MVARRYEWLLTDKVYKTKDIDIFLDSKSSLNLEKYFFDHGWDINNGSISQYFESNNVLVTIDLRTDLNFKYNIQFNELLNEADNDLGINIISNHHYYKIMFENFIKFKMLLVT